MPASSPPSLVSFSLSKTPSCYGEDISGKRHRWKVDENIFESVYFCRIVLPSDWEPWPMVLLVDNGELCIGPSSINYRLELKRGPVALESTLPP